MSDVEREVAAAVARFFETFASGDAGAMAALYTEDCLLGAPGAPLLRGRKQVEGFWGQMIGAMGMKDAEYRILSIEPVGEDFAAEVTAFSATIGGALHQGTYVVNWKRVDGAWRLHHDVFNAAPVVAEADEA